MGSGEFWALQTPGGYEVVAAATDQRGSQQKRLAPAGVRASPEPFLLYGAWGSWAGEGSSVLSGLVAGEQVVPQFSVSGQVSPCDPSLDSGH